MSKKPPLQNLGFKWWEHVTTNVRFIVISGHKQFDYAKGAMRNNVEDYLLKPINKEELESVLGNVHKQLREIQEKEQQKKL